jgi:hypothetical protein
MENALSNNAVSPLSGGEISQAPDDDDGVSLGLALPGALQGGVPVSLEAHQRDPHTHGFDSRSRLHKELAHLGLEIGQRQAKILTECYGSGPVAMREMVSDGVLSSTHLGAGGLSWSVNWSALSTEKLAGMVMRLGSEGSANSTGATARELSSGLDRLFAGSGVLAAKKARKIVRLYGKDGRISKDQIAQVLCLNRPVSQAASQNGPINLLRAMEAEAGRPTVGPIGLPGPSRQADGTQDWSRTEHAMVAYVMAFAGIREQLSLPQFAQAIASLSAGGGSAEGQLVSTLFGAFASTGAKGPVVSRAKVVEMIRRKALQAIPKPNGGYGFRVNPTVMAVDRTTADLSGGRIVARSGEHTLSPAASVTCASPEQAAIPQQLIATQHDLDDDLDAGGSALEEGVSQVLLGLGLNATIFGNLMIDYDRLQQRRRRCLPDVHHLDLTKLTAEQIATAVFQMASRDPDQDCLTTAEFETAVQELTDDADALTGGVAEVLVRLANTPLLTAGQRKSPENMGLRGTGIRFEGVVTVFDMRFVEILVGSGQQPYVVQYNPALAFAQPQPVFEFLGTFAEEPAELFLEDELRLALTSSAFRTFADPGATAARLCLMLGDIPRLPGAISAIALRSAIDLGVMALEADSAGGLQLNLARLPRDIIATAMFRHFGFDPEKDGLSTEQFDEALERISGDKGVMSMADVEFLAGEYASDLRDGLVRFTHADIRAILGLELSLINSTAGPDLRLGNQIDPRHRKPCYFNPATWDSGASLAGAYANDLVDAVSGSTRLPVATVTRVLGNIGSWGLRDPEASALVRDTLRKLWSESGPKVLAAAAALAKKLKTFPGLTAEVHELLENCEAQLHAGRSDGAIFLHLFWNDKSSIAPFLISAAKSLSTFFDASQAISTELSQLGLAASSRPGQGGRARLVS